jgi:hypothetical protein
LFELLTILSLKPIRGMFRIPEGNPRLYVNDPSEANVVHRNTGSGTNDTMVNSSSSASADTEKRIGCGCGSMDLERLWWFSLPARLVLLSTDRGSNNA